MAVDWKKVCCVLAGMVAVHKGEDVEKVLEKAIATAEAADEEA